MPDATGRSANASPARQIGLAAEVDGGACRRPETRLRTLPPDGHWLLDELSAGARLELRLGRYADRVTRAWVCMLDGQPGSRPGVPVVDRLFAEGMLDQVADEPGVLVLSAKGRAARSDVTPFGAGGCDGRERRTG